MPLAGLILTIFVITLGIFDLVVVLIKGTGSSISQYLVSKSFSSPMMVFAFGFVAGHLFAGMLPDTSPAWLHPNVIETAQLVTSWFFLIMLGVWVWGLIKRPSQSK